MKRKSLKFKTYVPIGFFLSICIVPIIAWTEEKQSTTKLDEMVITGNRQEQKLLNTPETIAIITRDDIENSGNKNVVDIISNVPGVINDSSGSTTYFSFRGNRTTMSGGPAIYPNGRSIKQGKSWYSLIDNILQI